MKMARTQPLIFTPSPLPMTDIRSFLDLTAVDSDGEGELLHAVSSEGEDVYIVDDFLRPDDEVEYLSEEGPAPTGTQEVIPEAPPRPANPAPPLPCAESPFRRESFATWNELKQFLAIEGGEAYGIIAAGRNLEQIFAYLVKDGQCPTEAEKSRHMRTTEFKKVRMRPKRLYVWNQEEYVWQWGETEYPKVESRPAPKLAFKRWKIWPIWHGLDPNDFSEHRALRMKGPLEVTGGLEVFSSKQLVLAYLTKYWMYQVGARENSWLKILPTSDPKQVHNIFAPPKTPAAFKDLIPKLKWESTRYEMVGGRRKKIVEKGTWDVVDDMKDLVQLERLIFDPGEANPGGYKDEDSDTLNMFRGTTKDQEGADLAMCTAIRKTNPIHYLWHLYVIRCNGCLRDFLLYVLLMSYTVQDATALMPFYIKLRGAQNTWKTRDMRVAVVHTQMDSRLVVTPGNFKEVTGHTTCEHLERKLNMQCDEGDTLTAKEQKQLKHWMTTDMIRSRILFHNPTNEKKVCQLVMVTGDQLEATDASDSTFERREFMLQAFAADVKYKDGLAGYKQFYKNLLHDGDISTEVRDWHEPLERLSETDVLDRPGLMSYYTFRLMVQLPRIDLSGLNPANRVSVERQILTVGGNQQTLYHIMQNNSFVSSDGEPGDTGIHVDAWEPSSDVFSRKIRKVISLVLIKQWRKYILQLFELIEYELLADFPDIFPKGCAAKRPCTACGNGECHASLFPNHLEDFLNSPSSDTNSWWPLEGDSDPYGRDPDLLVLLRNLWNVRYITSTEDMRKRTQSILGHPPEIRRKYEDTLGIIMLLDEEMSSDKSGEYKNHVCPIELIKKSPGKWVDAWVALCGDDALLDLKHVDLPISENTYYGKLVALLEKDELSNHAWKIEKIPCHVHQEDRQHANPVESARTTRGGTKSMVFVPSFAMLKKKLSDSKRAPYTIWKPKALITGSTRELAFATGVREQLNPWAVVHATQQALMRGEFKSFEELATQVFYSALGEGTPDWNKEASIERHKEHETGWHEAWEAYDATGENCPFQVENIHQFALLPLNLSYDALGSDEEEMSGV